MYDVLILTIPFFGIVALGAFSRAIGFFDADMGLKLARFAFYFVLPPFLFLSITAAPVEELFNLNFLLRYEIATITMLGLTGIASAYLFGFRGIKRGLYGLNAAYPNVGYIGVPLSLMAFGNDAILPLAMILSIDTIILMIMTAFFLGNDGTNTFWTSLQHTLKQLAKNPLILSAFLGIFWALSGLPVPVIAERWLSMLSGAAAPAALFALGITLYGSNLKGASLELGLLSLAKLIIHPALMVLLFYKAEGINPVWIQTAILSAALPIAANVFAMAQYYQIYAEKTAGAIMLSTILASISTPAVIYLLYQFY